MEFKAWLKVLVRKWWIVLPAFLITAISTVVFTFTQLPTYQAVATYLVTPNASFDNVNSLADSLDILGRRPEIGTTYAEVASSRLIRAQTVSALGLSPEQNKSLSVDSQLRAGTNILEITAEGNDPALTRDFANRVGAQTLTYVRGLYESYELRSLDQATLPTSPVRPNKVLNLALGAILGLVLGAGLAFLLEYLQAPLENIANFGILDAETGMYNKPYFLQRLREEMSRAKRNRYPMSLALMNVDHLGTMASTPPLVRSEALRKVAILLKKQLREEDIMAHLGDSILAFLLPDMPGEKAKETLERFQTRLTWTPIEIEGSNVKLNLSSVAGVTTYQHNGAGQDELLAQARHALDEAETAGGVTVSLQSENGGHSDQR